NTKMNKILAAVKEQGVEEKDISTQSLYLNPAYDYQDGRQVERRFEASQSLTVKVRNLDKIGEVLNAAVTQGANQAGGVSFTIDDPEELRKQAREMAITKAKAKAQLLAQQLGKTLGKLTDFNEGYVGYPVNYDRMEKSMAISAGGIAAPSPVVPAGEQEVSVTVTLSYELR
ncbi:MAG: SIMPL domain-containing protein, partial [Candidatus Peribacteraceae bacterium]|nr:SIMPL domain-containing protein [Candidatus Peribacteraceae bacterium]